MRRAAAWAAVGAAAMAVWLVVARTPLWELCWLPVLAAGIAAGRSGWAATGAVLVGTIAAEALFAARVLPATPERGGALQILLIEVGLAAGTALVGAVVGGAWARWRRRQAARLAASRRS